MAIVPEPVAILADPRNARGAQEYARLLKKTFRSQGIAPTPRVAKDTATIITLGGDGWLLSCVARYWRKERAFLGVNFGHQGFLLNEPPAATAFPPFDTLIEYEFPMLEATLWHTNGTVSSARALNDVYFNRTDRQSARMKVSANDLVVAENLMGDGLIVSTALGSTAYNRAAKGPPVEATIPAMLLTPICQYVPMQFEPLVLPLSTIITVEVLEPLKRPVQAGADTKGFRRIARAVIRDSEEKTRLCFLGEPNFTKRLRDKIMNVT